jgi:hypothetical protein
MVRFDRLFLTIGLVVTATGVARAQHPAHHDAAGIQAALLTNRSVQKELKLDEAQVEKVASLAKDVAARGRAAALEFKALPDSERREKMHALTTSVCAEAMSTLRDDRAESPSSTRCRWTGREGKSSSSFRSGLVKRAPDRGSGGGMF